MYIPNESFVDKNVLVVYFCCKPPSNSIMEDRKWKERDTSVESKK